jgi:hypothetical protein
LIRTTGGLLVSSIDSSAAAASASSSVGRGAPNTPAGIPVPSSSAACTSRSWALPDASMSEC